MALAYTITIENSEIRRRGRNSQEIVYIAGFVEQKEE